MNIIALCCIHHPVNSQVVGKSSQLGPVLFPSASNNQIPNENTNKPITVATSGTTTTTPTPQYARCFSDCQTTPEYNPVCGTNGVTYDNAGKLSCARRCGTGELLENK